MELRREHAELTAERADLAALLASDAKQWTKVAKDLRQVRTALAKPPNGARRSEIVRDFVDSAAPSPDAYIAREPITVILSERGWIRAARGAVADPSELKFKEGDKLAFLVPAETTDKLMIPGLGRPLLHPALRQAPLGARPGRAAAPDAGRGRPRKNHQCLPPTRPAESACWRPASATASCWTRPRRWPTAAPARRC